MASEPTPMIAEHAYPLRVGCAAQGCAVMFLVVVGTIAATMLPAGYFRFVNGDVPLGVLLCVLGLIGLPALILAPILMFSGLREVLNPELLVLTKTALVLPGTWPNTTVMPRASAIRATARPMAPAPIISRRLPASSCSGLVKKEKSAQDSQVPVRTRWAWPATSLVKCKISATTNWATLAVE